MAFRKGGPNPSRGRKPGSKNKLSATLKETILEALAMAGGKEYLFAQAEKNPTAFMTLVGRVLPLQVKDDGAEPVMPTDVSHHYDSPGK